MNPVTFITLKAALFPSTFSSLEASASCRFRDRLRLRTETEDMEQSFRFPEVSGPVRNVAGCGSSQSNGTRANTQQKNAEKDVKTNTARVSQAEGTPKGDGTEGSIVCA